MFGRNAKAQDKVRSDASPTEPVREPKAAKPRPTTSSPPGFLALFAPRAARPIATLTRAVAAARQGDYDSGIEIAARGPVGALVEGFNGLLEALRAREAATAARVARLEQIVADQDVALRQFEATALAAETARTDILATLGRQIRTQVEGAAGLASAIAPRLVP